MKKIWFTADTHFGHRNIIQYTNRPYRDTDEMDEALIENWNARISPDDDVYHLGDFALCDTGALDKILDRLHGNIHLIVGNHEKSALTRVRRFVWVKDYFELVVPDATANRGSRLVVLMHYAMRVWNASHHGAWQLYGHSHGTLPDDPTLLSIDVGVDCHGYGPISYEEVAAIMEKKTWVPPFG
jgi:calcineurin-like phosphoesterase family protein